MLAGMIGPTIVDGGAEPACPDCATLMRATAGADMCPSCGLVVPWPDVPQARPDWLR